MMYLKSLRLNYCLIEIIVLFYFLLCYNMERFKFSIVNDVRRFWKGKEFVKFRVLFRK